MARTRAALKPSAAPDVSNDLTKVVAGIGGQRSGAERDAIGRIVDGIDDPLKRGPIGDDPGQAEDGPGRIVRMQRHAHTRARRNWNYAVEKVSEIFP